MGKRVLPAFKSEIEAVLVHSQSQIATVKWHLQNIEQKQWQLAGSYSRCKPKITRTGEFAEEFAKYYIKSRGMVMR